MKFISFANGKKTYAVVAIGIGLGVAQYYGVHIPGWLDWVLTFLGMGTLRAGVTAQSAKAAGDIAELAKLILANVTVADPNADTTGATIKVQPAVEVHELPPIGK